MLKWKSHKFSAIANNVESLRDMLSGMAGKNRVIKFIVADIDADIFIRVYRDADQIINFECDLLTTSAPILPMDLALAEGQLCKIGFYNENAGSVTPSIAIGYEESD